MYGSMYGGCPNAARREQALPPSPESPPAPVTQAVEQQPAPAGFWGRRSPPPAPASEEKAVASLSQEPPHHGFWGPSNNNNYWGHSREEYERRERDFERFKTQAGDAVSFIHLSTSRKVIELFHVDD